MSEVARVHSDAATARARIDRIAAHVAASRQDIIDAHRERDWLALGYATWDELCEAEFRGAMIGLPRGERREAVAEMTDAGMSTRAIGAALGVSEGTIRNDRGAQDYAPVDRECRMSANDDGLTAAANPDDYLIGYEDGYDEGKAVAEGETERYYAADVEWYFTRHQELSDDSRALVYQVLREVAL